MGDEIVLASTDYDPRQAERRTIAAISGNKITLDKKLDYMHFGKITFDVDERGEVGLLTRNIKVQASADAEQSFFGGHIMAMVSSHMYVEGVELNRMGQNLTLARYPIHWHLVGDAKGQYIRNAAIHDTYNRCVTVHGTNYLQVENNVTYNTVGHCFFMEDGIEHGNQFVHNLAIQTKCHTSKPCDPTNLAPFGSSTDGLNFKTHRPGLQGSPDPFGQHGVDLLDHQPGQHLPRQRGRGFRRDRFLARLPGASDGRSSKARISARPRGRVARSSASSRATSPIRTSTVSWATAPPGPMAISPSAGMFPWSIPLTRTAHQAESVVEDFTAYKNRNSGIWARGELRLYKNLKMADNGIGFTQASGNFGQSAYTSRVVDSLFVGESENIGNPSDAGGNGLRPQLAAARGRGFPDPRLRVLRLPS